MSIDNKLDKLKNIRQVEAPVFLFTRIKQRIESMAEAPAPVTWKLVFAGTAIFLLMLNIGILFKNSQQSKPHALEQVINTLQLSTSNDLYHE